LVIERGNCFVEPVIGAGVCGLVDGQSLRRQLQAAKAEARSNLKFHRALLAGEDSYTVGGGIGRSRICMFFLKKAHIGEVQHGS
jgi:aspartate--ammonia ligase